MSIVQGILYGLLSGISAILPISLTGHQSLLNLLFGTDSPEPIRDMFIHISIALVVIVSSNTYLKRILRDINRPVRSRKNGRREMSPYAYDLRLIKSSILPMAVCFVILKLLPIATDSFVLLALFFLLNGLMLYIVEHIPHGNRDGSKLSAFDGLLMGVSSALCVFPGISRVGASMSCLLARGADRSKAFQWILLLTIPVSAILIVFDFIGLFTVGIGAVTFLSFIGYIISAVFSFFAAYGGIYLMRFISIRTGYSVFAFYSWAVALLSFVLYLIA